MIYEVINPSDKVTFEAPDIDIARLAVLLLGSGKYSIRAKVEIKEDIPFFPFGVSDDALDTWITNNYPGCSTLLDALDKYHKGIAEALESVIYIGLNDREGIKAAVGNDPEAMKRFNEHKRSSMNNIGARAQDLVKVLRERYANGTIAGGTNG